MAHIHLVTGQAGTGKTAWLVEKTVELHPDMLREEHSRILAITKMHGARRRVTAKLQEILPPNKAVVTTLDSFALAIVNRWRSAFGWSRPIHSASVESHFADTAFGIEANFDEIARAAGKALEFQTIKRIIGASYPLVVIDEFQDCYGPHLELVAALADCATLLLAADEFQLLQGAHEACSAVAWVRELEKNGDATTTELLQPRRSSTKGILEASRCLRSNEQSERVTVPVICCPNAGPMAWKILEMLVLSHTRWTGTTALISPSRDPLISRVLQSLNEQILKRHLKPLRWLEEISSDEDVGRITSGIGLTNSHDSISHWVPPDDTNDKLTNQILKRLRRIARLTGSETLPSSVVCRHVEAFVHENRAFRPETFLRSVLTVHGAKNREFRNVIVIWPYTVPPGKELQQRLLYNAITRAKDNCIVLVLGDLNRAKIDPVLSLLGPAQPVFPNKKH